MLKFFSMIDHAIERLFTWGLREKREHKSTKSQGPLMHPNCRCREETEPTWPAEQIFIDSLWTDFRSTEKKECCRDIEALLNSGNTRLHYLIGDNHKAMKILFCPGCGRRAKD